MGQPQEPAYEMYASEQKWNSWSWRRPSDHGQSDRMTNYKEPIIEGFQYDKVMFGTGFAPSQNAKDLPGDVLGNGQRTNETSV